ncbi:hypothetical protein [Accumulibacter sp.]|uniref:hypothetical protein n=1 Tax=Accumulibacter sp. TaxID=2053492 RepID=UPI00261EC28D|nr:hypothetical protein [Accumulibacter sp.]
MEDETETTPEELAEELTELAASCSRFQKRYEASVDVLELVIRKLFDDPEKAKNLAYDIETLAVEREWLDEGNPAIPWLRKVRDDLLSWFHLAPFVQQAIARGELRPIPLRERLSVVSSERTTPQTHCVPPPDPRPEEEQ